MWGLLAFCLLAAGGSAAGPTPPGQAVASAHPEATAAGIAVLEAGGNAFDAAVAVSAVLAVVEPYSSGLGGGGFWLLHRASDGFEVMVDGRERAPLRARRDMYLDAEGEPIPGASIDGPLAAGIPGEPAALVHISRHYGRLPLSLVLAPAIRLAREGFLVDERYRRFAQRRLEALRASPAAAKLFLKDGKVPPLGYRIVQPALAETLTRIAEAGKAGFYAGTVADHLVAGVKAAGGIWTGEDLAAYRVVEREPVVGRFQGYRIISAPPPSSGGVVLIEMLNMLDALKVTDQPSAQQVHLMVEAMRRAYEDRARYLGDSDLVRVPVRRLIDPAYARVRASDIDPQRATASRPFGTNTPKGTDTTHFSIIDRQGNRVAATLSINYLFGSGFVAPGTGVLLNDEMDDFSIKPGVPNVYGLVGNEANAIEPGKRMLSSMTPTFIDNDGMVGVLGTPGGSRIISMVLIGVLQAVAEAPVDHWVGKARFHHQYLPDEIQFEPGAFTPKTRAYLRKIGHKLHELDEPYGNMQAVRWDRNTGKLSAASDPRGIGAAWVTGE
ncbi:MAG: gamma-glutamyltransferase [Gammaproteobacteria bacterium]|nr:MAG: gamma-glutamyltransferase [Gammaproteobacteria bacterium]